MKPARLFTLALLLCACTEAEPSVAQPPAQPESLNATRAYVFRNCPVSAKLGLRPAPTAVELLEGDGSASDPESALALAPLAGALVEPLVGLAGDFVTAWLDDRAKQRSATTTALANGVLLVKPWSTGAASQETGIPHFLPCLVMIQGRFGDPVERLDTALLQPASEAERRDWDWPAPWLSLFGLVEKPRLYMELKLVASPVYDAFRLVPLYMDLRSTAVNQGGGKPVHLALTAVISLRGTSLGATVVPLPSPVAGATRLTAAHLGASSSAWVALPRPMAATPGSVSIDNLANGAFSVQLTFVETIEPAPVDRLIARTFGAIRQPLAEQAVSILRSNVGSTEQERKH